MRQEVGEVLSFRFEQVDQFLAAPPQRWIVDGILPSRAFAAVYGPSGAGKSFLALDLSIAVAEGSRWFGQRVSPATVFYVCLEGVDGFRTRLRALLRARGGEIPERWHLVTGAINLTHRWHVRLLSKELQERGAAGGLVIVDTLMRAAVGIDENSGSDMATLVAMCNELQNECGCTVLLIHHTGKDAARGLRGHSSLLAALDVAIEVKKLGSGATREWLISKSKDAEAGIRYAFTLMPVHLGQGENGEAIASCVVGEPRRGSPTAPASPGTRGGNRGNQLIAYNALRELLATAQDTARGGAPDGVSCVQWNTLLSATADRLTCRHSDRRNRAFNAVNGLVRRGVCGSGDGWVWIIASCV